MDTIADMLTIIRNGYLARKNVVTSPHSKIKEEIARKLLDLKYLESVHVDSDKRTLTLTLSYKEGVPAVEGIQRISKPSLRIYTGVKETPRVLSGIGEVILSTPKGIKSGREVRREKTGGELILKVW